MKRTFLLGLTGSAAMGKSTIAAMFGQQGIPVWDADSTVHQIYAMRDGPATSRIAELAPQAIRQGTIDRKELSRLLRADPALLPEVERIVHPLVAADRARFRQTLPPGTRLAVFDIPLLFETGSEPEFDAVLVVTAPPEIQRERLMARPGMTAAHAALILSRQMPDSEKRRRADFVIDTNQSLDQCRQQVAVLVRTLGGAEIA